jgi:hypothetical protein
MDVHDPFKRLELQGCKQNAEEPTEFGTRGEEQEHAPSFSNETRQSHLINIL